MLFNRGQQIDTGEKNRNLSIWIATFRIMKPGAYLSPCTKLNVAQILICLISKTLESVIKVVKTEVSEESSQPLEFLTLPMLRPKGLSCPVEFSN